MPTEVLPGLLSWATDVEPNTIEQAGRAARLPFVAGHVALMPDAHLGKGATVGSVIPTKGAIIPAAVGVDIGCGMIAAHTTLTATHLPDDLQHLLPIVESAVPAGVGKGHHQAGSHALAWMSAHRPATELSDALEARALSQFGSLGSGNHFFEICMDERDHVWVVLHSGSRGIGNVLATRHIDKAKGLAKQWFLELEDPDLAYLPEGTPEFDHYIADMLWAQDYAMANRQTMMDAALAALTVATGIDWAPDDVVNCHHNFCERENHRNQNVWVTRKGAIRARSGDRGVIPGSMGTRSYIVTGKGNPASWMSCSHGAGRRHSRGAARRLFTVQDLAEQMTGKTWLADRAGDLLDEIPSAYKDIDKVMADQTDLVQIEHTLHQVLNYKGT